jgi:lantibiotic biosynthesis protein
MKEIEKKLLEITEIIKNTDCTNNSLLSGNSGIAVFLAYVNQRYNDPDLNSEMENALSKSLEAFGNEDSTYTFGNGFSGICWGLSHLVKQKIVEAEVSSIFEDIHPLLISTSESDMKINFFDFLHGGLGAGIYFLDHVSDPIAKAHISSSILHLHHHAVINEGDIMWANLHYRLNNESKNTEYNLGLSHGIPSIIWFLTKCYEQKIEKEKCQFLINGALQWIMKQKLSDTANSKYPIAIEGSASLKNSRLGWCYGDLGIASVLWQAGKALENDVYKNEAVNIMLHASTRRDLSENGITDAGLCHGTSGIAHIFNRFYRETKNPVFKETAAYWIEETLKMAHHDDGLAGYKFWDGKKSWVNSEGLLEGIAGIGLALYSHLSEEESHWDRCLLLS